MRYKYTDKEMKLIIDKMVVIVDSREQNNQHIIDFFDKKKIPYKRVKNDFGDYTAMIPKGTIGQFTADIYFDRDICIERKNSIDELAGNLKDDAARLKKELAHLNMNQIKYFFFVEDPKYHENLRNGNYRSQYDPFTLMMRIKKGIEAEYNTVIVPVDKKCMGSEIYYTLQAFVYALFKHKGFIIEESEELEDERLS